MSQAFHKYICLALLSLTLALGGCGNKQTPAETPRGTEAPAAGASAEPGEKAALRISELMPSNQSTLADETGDFPDWLELYNAGEESVALAGFRLQCGGRELVLTEGELESGAYRLILCPADGELRLPRDGGELVLLDPRERRVDSLPYPAMEADQSACRTEDGAVEITTWVSPGYANSKEGYEAYQASLGAPEGLLINEVMVYNDRYLPQAGQYYDWVEILNPTDQIIQAGDYYLSDKGKDRLLYPLPSRRMRPGERMLIFCTEEINPAIANRAPFGLSSEGETLYLSRSDGTLQDYVNLHDIPLGCSFGRMDGIGGFCYMGEPTPGKDNKQGYRLIAEQPVLIGEDGWFQNVESVTVTLQGEGSIHYTLDGSTPTKDSPAYTGPFDLEQTTAVRAVSLVPGRMPSPVLNLSYILNEEHTLPVVSLVADQGDLFGRNGLYDHPSEDWERPATIAYYGEDGSFRLDCGVKLHGATSKITQPKKSLKLNFRERYAGELHYDLFQNGVTDFSSILLRAAQESSQSTYIHDTLMHELAEECFPELPAQDHKYAVLYINGRYWGVYNIREAHSEEHYARHYGYAVDSVSHWKKIWGHNTPAEEVCDFVLNNDMRDEDNYAYAAAHINLDSVIGWSILQAYCGNFDCNSPNMRFYWSDEDQMLRYALVDLDLGMYSLETWEIPFQFGYEYNRLAEQLMQNPDFRERLCRKLKQVLDGPMSDEAVLSRIDALADELRPEIGRDLERWEGGRNEWEALVQDTKNFVNAVEGGRAAYMIESLHLQNYLTRAELELYFGSAA